MEQGTMPPYTIPPGQLWAEIIRLANESDHSWRFTKKGDKRPPEDVERMMASRRRTIKAKQALAAERIEAARRATRAAKISDGPIADRMLRAMEPGKWYGMGDLMRLAGTDRSGRSKVHQVLKAGGWIEKAANPRYAGPVNPFRIIEMGEEPEPKHLYRLTQAGEVRREGLLRP